MKYRLRPQLKLESLERRDLLTTLVDLDADGDLDIVTDQGWHENSDTYGNFVVHEYPSLNAATAGDIDGDGDLDIVGVDGWIENTDGQGTFGDLQTIPVPHRASVGTVKLYDVGGDGDIDVIMHGRERVLHFDNNDGRGTFELVDDFVIPSLSDVGDVDNDGRIDAAKIEGRSTWIHRNVGEGRFERSLWHEDEDPAEFPGHEFEIEQTYMVRFIDANVDGWLDVARVQGADGLSSVVIHVNDQTGNAGAGQGAIGSCFGGCGYRFDDFDQDGATDFMVSETDVFLFLFRNDGLGNFQQTPHTDNSVRSDSVIRVGDINRDGLFDLLMKSYEWVDGATGELHVPGATIDLQKPGPHTFVSRRLGKAAAGVFASAIADLNGNDTADLIIAHDSLEVWEQGQEPRVIRENKSHVRKIEAADMDGDGDDDIVFREGLSLRWLENLGEGRFASPRTIEPRSADYWALGDFNQDGLVDVVTASRRAGVFGLSTLSLRINRGDSFSASDLAVNGKTVLALTVADVDGDRDVDVYVETGRWAPVGGHVRIFESLWFENQDGQVRDQQSLGAGRSAISLLSDDLSGDGRPDLLITSYSGVAWRDAFEGPDRHITDEENPVSIADVDEDGDLDVIGHSGNRVVWYENQDGQGTFSDMQVIGTVLVSTGVHVGDSSGNGQMDVVAIHRSGPISVFEKRVTGDSNGDSVFNSSDLVTVFQHGEYEDQVLRNSTFESGDWNRDGEFDSSDFVHVMQAGTYILGMTQK